MNNLSTLGAILVSRWTKSFAGMATASLLVWYLGPLIPGMAGPMPRALAILAIGLVWGGVNGALSWRGRRRRQALSHAMTADEAGQAAGNTGARQDAAAEISALRCRMRQALNRLQARRGGRHLYERPWFVLIGPPGSGKTTALRQSGLHFPLETGDGRHALGGVGGTRLCDWWFADEAVLIDTAGRYTTQESDAVVDKAGWLGFLDLLRRTRARQPLNGVLVVLSLVDLATAEPAERSAHARTIRRRIDELTQRLGARIPIYVMFSKADRLAGFDAFFDDLDAESRAQVWGATFALDGGVELFAAEFRLLLDRLQSRLVERLQSERSAERRAQIAGFPLQLASLAQPLASFMTEAFTGSRLDPAPFLRGVYLTSATQEGTPIDRLTGMLARAFGVDQQRAPSLRPAAERAYFVEKLVREVILREALLVSRDPRRMRRRRLVRTAGLSAVGVATVAGALLLWRADAANRIAVEHGDEALAVYRQQLAAVKLDPVSDGDLVTVAPLLDAALSLPGGKPGWPGGLFGLSQADKLAQSDRLATRHTLERVLLPRLVAQLEQQMRSRFDDPDFLYRATRIYLMLGSAGPLDKAVLRNWMQTDWAQRYPGVLNETLRDHLAVELTELMNDPLPPVTLDGALVDGARATFSRVSLAQRVYSRLRGSDAAQPVSGWSAAAALDTAGQLVFTRPSGKALSDGIPGFLTAAGFHGGLERGLPATTRAVAGESWVLGHVQQIPSGGPAVVQLEQAVIALWVADAETAWDGLLRDIALAPFGGHDRAVASLYVLSSPQSPIRDLLSAIDQQVTLNASSGSFHAAAAPPALDDAARGFADHYQQLRALTAALPDTAGSGTPLDGVLRLVNQLQQELARAGADGAAVPGTLQGSGDPAQLLAAEAERQPQPLSRWLHQIAATGTTSLGSAARSAASSAFARADGPASLCRDVVSGHYPFDPASGQDAPIDDFSRLFAPNGLLDAFFQSELRPYVDTTGQVWRAHALGGVAAPADAATVAEFQRAAAIRDMFFPIGGTVPSFRFTIQPAPDSAAASLHFGSLSATGTQTISVAWPGSDGIGSASLSAGTGEALQESGPWALLRLLDHGRLHPQGDADHFTWRVDVSGQSLAFDILAGSSHNPFARNLLRGFRCPAMN